MSTPEMWTSDDIATYLGIAPTSVRRQLFRWGIRPTGRQPGRSGKNLYDPDDIRHAHAHRPGQGNHHTPKDTR